MGKPMNAAVRSILTMFGEQTLDELRQSIHPTARRYLPETLSRLRRRGIIQVKGNRVKLKGAGIATINR